MQITSYDFSRRPERAGTGSLKWDRFLGQADAQGRPVLPLWVADMDFCTAPEIIEALQQRVRDGVFGYTIPYAKAESAVLAYLQRVHQFEAQKNWLHWLHGCVPGLNVFARAFGQPGDEILTCTPVYPPFLSSPVNQGKKVVTSHLQRQGRRWTFDFEDLERKVTSRTKAFTLCQPHNPVGTVYTPEELTRLGEFCLKHELVLCSDEIHCDLLYPGVQHTMTATLSPEIADITVTLHAPSKTYNLPGLSCAYAVIPNAGLRAQFARAASGFVTEVNVLGYVGCQTAYDRGGQWRQALMAQLTANRDLLYAFTAEHLSPWLKLEQDMEATYLAWLNVEGLRDHGIAHPQEFFVREAGVGLSPGSDFGDERYLRLNFGCPQTLLQEALERMAEALQRLRP